MSPLQLLVLILGLSFIALLIVYCLTLVRQQQLVKRTVTEQIRELSRQSLDRLHAEQALRTTEERFRLLMGATNDAVWDWDLLTNAVWWNDGIQTLFGYAKEAVRPDATWWIEQIHPEDQQRVVSGISAGIEGDGQTWSDEHRYRRANGSYAFVANRGYLVRDAQGKAIRMVGSMTDITARKHLEQQLLKQTTELKASNQKLIAREEVMRSLLEDLQTAKDRIEQQAHTLQAANTRLQDLTTVKDEFVAKVSHELRTPLTSIKEGLSLLLDKALGPITGEQQDFLKTMDGDMDRLTELINNMLDLSKIEAGRMRLQRRRSDLRAIVQSLLQSFQPLFGNRTVCTEADGVPLVFVDENRVRQIFTNLLSNALKFTADDGTITFRLGRHADQVTVAVEDNGPGIPPEDLTKLFQKFSQVGSREVGQIRGTGLGLVVCKELAELHGGRIEVASQPGRGTTFTVSLPIYTDTLALTESFRELREAALPEEGDRVGLVAVDAAAAVGQGGTAAEPHAGLTVLADEVRRYVHRGDIVLTVNPQWIVVLAHADREGCEAMVKRLQGSLGEAAQLRFGAAVYPEDAKDATVLFHRASTSIA
jgi:PAS domain S-box-containing protein